MGLIDRDLSCLMDRSCRVKLTTNTYTHTYMHGSMGVQGKKAGVEVVLTFDFLIPFCRNCLIDESAQQGLWVCMQGRIDRRVRKC